MSATTSGIIYDLRLNAPALDADLGQAEARVTASVTRMNALRVVIPVSLDLSAFNAQAAQVNAQLQQWGTNQIGGPGGAGGGNTYSAAFNAYSQTQNNVNLTAVQNNLTAIQQNNQAIANTYTQINQTFTQVNNAAAQAAQSAQGTANNLRALHRGLYALAAVAQSAELVGDLGKIFSSDTLAQRASAVKETRQDIRAIPIVGPLALSLGTGIGNLANATGNFLKGRAFESDEGYAERIGEEQEVREAQLKRMARDAAVGRKTEQQLETYEDRQRRDARPADSVADRHRNEVQDVNQSAADLRKRLEDERGGSPLSAADRQRIEGARFAEVGRLNLNYAVEQAEARNQQYSEIAGLRAGNAGRTTDQRRIEFSERLRREQQAAERESPASEARFRTDIAPEKQKQFDRDELLKAEKEKTDSAQRVADITGRTLEIGLRQAGYTYAADVQAYNRAWDDKLAKMQEAVDQERDVDEKRRRQDELEAARRERAADQTAYIEQRKRDEESKTLEHESRLAVLRLQTAGQTEAASRAALAKQYDDRIAKLGPNDPDRARWEAEKQAALGAFDADRSRRAAALGEQNREADLRQRGQGGLATLLGIRAQAEKDLREAEGDPALQRQIQERERLQVLELQHRAGAGRAEAISPNRTDPMNRLGDAGEDQSRLLDAIWKTLKEIEKKTGPAVTS
jgi:hypothetical protein